jgi:phosphate:Na+ symporter
MELLQYWQLLAGLGLFLYGMMQIEQALKGFGSDAFTRLLQKHTKTPLGGVFTGALASAFLQSSSVVGLMVLAFVGAGILQMRNALGIIFGANLGTTFTAWLVTLVGFKLELGSIAMPLLAIGSLNIVFMKQSSRLFFWGVLAFGFGLLLFGLDYMKTSVEALASLNIKEHVNYSLFYFLIAGMALTAVIQSSSAATMIALSALHGGIIDLPGAAAFIIGTNIGTTFTLILGSMNGTADKKRLAAAHLLFNVVTAVPVFLLLKPILHAIQVIFSTNDPLFLLSLFHTIFNFIGVLIFLPITGFLADKLMLIFNRAENRACVFVSSLPDSISKDVIDAIMISVERESYRLLLKVLLLEARSFKIEESLIVTAPERQQYRIQDTLHRITYEECYSELKEIEGELMAFIYGVQNNTSYPQESEHLSLIHHGVHMMVYAAKSIKDIRQDLVDIRHKSNVPPAFTQEHLEKNIKLFCRQLISLGQINNNVAYDEKLNELRLLIQEDYDLRKRDLISASRSMGISDIDLSTLLHINKAILLAHNALLESVEMKKA